MPAQIFALFMGVLLLIEGIWGFFSPVVFGVLDTNPLHAILGIGLGIAGVRVARECGSARRYCWWLGASMLVAGGLTLTPDFETLIYVILEINHVEAVFSVGFAFMAFIAAYNSRSRPMVLRLRSYDLPAYQLRAAPLVPVSHSGRPGHASPL